MAVKTEREKDFKNEFLGKGTRDLMKENLIPDVLTLLQEVNR